MMTAACWGGDRCFASCWMLVLLCFDESGVGVERGMVGGEATLMTTIVKHKPHTHTRPAYRKEGIVSRGRTRDATGRHTRSTFAWRKEKEGRTSERGWPRRGQLRGGFFSTAGVCLPWDHRMDLVLPTLTLTTSSSSICWRCAGWGAGWWRSAAALCLSIMRGGGLIA
jgi:hypothetical protein